MGRNHNENCGQPENEGQQDERDKWSSSVENGGFDRDGNCDNVSLD